MAVRELCLFLLQETAVREHDAAQLKGRRRAVHLAMKAALHEQRNVAAMIDVCVREHDGVDALRDRRAAATSS